MAAAGLIGGVSGLYSLHVPYGLSLLGAVVSLGFAWKFVEPSMAVTASPFLRQIGLCISYFKTPHLFWLFGFFVLGYSLEHVPAEFNQPFVKLLQIDWFGHSDKSALISGVVIALSMLSGAIGASISMALTRRLGVGKVLLTGIIIECVIIATMALALHPMVLLIVIFRNFPMALTQAPMLGAIAPHIDSAHRATYLSIQSLAGRLAFSALLFTLSRLVGGGSDAASNTEMHWPELALLLRTCLFVAVVGLIVLFMTRKAVSNS